MLRRPALGLVREAPQAGAKVRGPDVEAVGISSEPAAGLTPREPLVQHDRHIAEPVANAQCA
jgi:hypothetical protein